MIAIQIPQMQYLISKRWTFEHPMRVDSAGKPMGPAIAIAGAAGTIGAGISMGGVLGGLMIAGGIASGIGGLSGNKFLSNLGMGLSLAGGIGGAFTAAGPGQELFGYNPFGEGGFGGSALGDAMGGLGDWFKDFTGGGTAGTGLPQVGVDASQVADLSGAAADTIESQALGNGGALQYLDGESTSGGGLLGKLGSATRSFLPGESGGIPGGGLLGNKDFLSAISGGVDGYYDGKKLDILEDNSRAEIGLYNAKTQGELQDQRFKDQQYSNLQYQTVSAPTANPNYSPAEYTGPAGPRYVVQDPASGNILNLTAEQYAAWKQQQGAQA